MEKECIKVLPTPDVRHRKQYYDAGSIAAQIACVEIPQLNLEETAFLWSCLAMVIKDCDDYLDGLGDEMKRKDFADYILAVLFSEADQQFENAEFSAVRNHIATFDDKRKRRAKIDGKLLFYATEKVKNASNPKEYSKYVAVEGALTMEFLISLLLVSEAQEDDLHKFKRWSKKGVAMGNLFDSLIDLKADKKNGLFKELPFLNTALKLTRDIVLYLVRVLPHIPKKFLFQLIYGNFKAILIKK